MPYISKERRNQFETEPELHSPQTPGELNYVITRTLQDYLFNFNTVLSYSHLNEVIGVLECCKQEAYRRLAVPYEDQKIEDNGDVY